ncbi:hypothetical protein [Sanyastnella coralliicola]|uniref:hypothetical protein n=1 Tax=Sanyastnella coralliicola TaxID=3069118 RepID=UPI0027BAAF9A|nr:hypothetical protein [Longitalea sp. SCSIO 12813]
MKRFLTSNLLVTALLVALYMVLVYGFNQPYIWAIPAMIVVFGFINLLSKRMMERSETKSPGRFVAAFTGVIGIKLMVAMVVTLLYLLLIKDDAISFVIALFVTYMSFTILLVRSAMKQRQISQQEGNEND